MNASEKLFRTYEHLAIKYSSKLFHLEVISFDKDDIKQEFRVKLFEIILAYGNRWSEFRDGKRAKPIPLVFYIRSAFNNFVYDYIQNIQKNKKNHFFIPDGLEVFDFGVENKDNCKIDLSKDICVINDINIMDGLKDDKLKIFSLFLQGFEESDIAVELGEKKKTITNIINKQRKVLEPLYKDLVQIDKQSFFVMKEVC